MHVFHDGGANGAHARVETDETAMEEEHQTNDDGHGSVDDCPPPQHVEESPTQLPQNCVCFPSIMN